MNSQIKTSESDVSNKYKGRGGKETSSTPWWMKEDDDGGRGASKSSQKTSTPAKSFIKQPKPAGNKQETTIESHEPKYETNFTPAAKKTTTFKLDEPEEKRYSEDFEEMPKLSLDNQSTFSSFRNGTLNLMFVFFLFQFCVIFAFFFFY